MQFGQLLTHLDTTQQMIASSLKDNATLLTQVCAPFLVCCLPSSAHTHQVLQLYLQRALPYPFGSMVLWQGLGLSLHAVSQWLWDL